MEIRFLPLSKLGPSVDCLMLLNLQPVALLALMVDTTIVHLLDDRLMLLGTQFTYVALSVYSHFLILSPHHLINLGKQPLILDVSVFDGSRLLWQSWDLNI